MNESKIDVVADALAKAWREGGSVPPLAAELLPVDLTEAYQIQDALDERLAFELVGWIIYDNTINLDHLKEQVAGANRSIFIS